MRLSLTGEPSDRFQLKAIQGLSTICLTTVLYLVIETFKNGDAKPVYERFAKEGRLAPEGLAYHGSWVTTDLRRCYQIMECDDERLLRQWIANWQDLVAFEVIPVISSAEAMGAVVGNCPP